MSEINETRARHAKDDLVKGIVDQQRAGGQIVSQSEAEAQAAPILDEALRQAQDSMDGTRRVDTPITGGRQRPFKELSDVDAIVDAAKAAVGNSYRDDARAVLSPMRVAIQSRFMSLLRHQDAAVRDTARAKLHRIAVGGWKAGDVVSLLEYSATVLGDVRL